MLLFSPGVRRTSGRSWTAMGIHIFCKLGGWGWRMGIRRRWISIWIGNGHLERKGVATLRITHRTPQAITSNQFSLHITTQKFHYDDVITNYFMNIILSTPTYNDIKIHSTQIQIHTPLQACSKLKRLLWNTRSMTIFASTYIHTYISYPILSIYQFKMFYVLRLLAISFPRLTHDEQWHAIMTDEWMKMNETSASRYYRRDIERSKTHHIDRLRSDHRDFLLKISFYRFQICHFGAAFSISRGAVFLVPNTVLSVAFDLCCLSWNGRYELLG